MRSLPDQLVTDRPLMERLRPALRWETGLVVVVIGIGILGVSTSSGFLTGNNIFNLGLQSGEIAIMALPMTLIIISGEIDLSVASILGMASALLGVLWSRHWPMPAIFVVVAIVGYAMRTFRPARELYAIGSNPDAAALAGIPSARRVFVAFVTSGALAGLGDVEEREDAGVLGPRVVVLDRHLLGDLVPVPRGRR